MPTLSNTNAAFRWMVCLPFGMTYVGWRISLLCGQKIIKCVVEGRKKAEDI